MSNFNCVSFLLLAATLTGCVAPQPKLYAWGTYQDQVHSYLTSPDGDVVAQAAELERLQEEAKATNGVMPPGFHAHIGLLYASMGRVDQAATAFNAEKAQYPESAAYMDFLLRNKSKGNGQ